MIADDLALFVETRGMGTRGVSIFVGEIPDSIPSEPGAAIGLIEFSGPAPVSDFGGILFERARVQVRVRGLSHDAAHRKVDDLVSAFDAVANTVIDGTRYGRIYVVTHPASLGLDTAGRTTFVFDIGADKAPSAV